MTNDPAGRQYRLLTLHCALWSLGMSLACGFVDAYILRLGFGIAATLIMHAGLLSLRFCLRAAILPLIRRLSTRRAILLGACIAALQFLPLINADRPLWLAIWIATVSLGECIYWPIYHAANAVCGGGGQRGRQLAVRQATSTLISLIGPIAGGVLLTRVGPTAEFATASALTLAAVIPLLRIGHLELGYVPSMRQSFRAADRLAMAAFAADGWICASLSIAWPMILFTSLDASYTTFGRASGAAAMAGALTGLGCGIAIDRGHRRRISRIVSFSLVIGIGLRVASAWVPWMVLPATILAACVSGLYVPALMSVIYDRAKSSGSAYQFHLSAEAGWDGGCILGCLAVASLASTTLPITLTVLPATLGVIVVHRCIRAESSPHMIAAPTIATALA